MNRIWTIAIIGIIIFGAIYFVFGFDPRTISSDVNVGMSLYKVVVTVEGTWIHYDLFLEDKLTIDYATYRVEPIWSFSVYPFSSAGMDNAKMVFKIYNENDELIKTVETEFYIREGKWTHVFELKGLDKGSYTIEMELYQWVSEGIGPIKFNERYVYKDTYSIEVTI